jgi:hypothetical protein
MLPQICQVLGEVPLKPYGHSFAIFVWFLPYFIELTIHASREAARAAGLEVVKIERPVALRLNEVPLLGHGLTLPSC